MKKREETQYKEKPERIYTGNEPGISNTQNIDQPSQKQSWLQTEIFPGLFGKTKLARTSCILFLLILIVFGLLWAVLFETMDTYTYTPEEIMEEFLTLLVWLFFLGGMIFNTALLTLFGGISAAKRRIAAAMGISTIVSFVIGSTAIDASLWIYGVLGALLSSIWHWIRRQ